MTILKMALATLSQTICDTKSDAEWPGFGKVMTQMIENMGLMNLRNFSGKFFGNFLEDVKVGIFSHPIIEVDLTRRST